MKYLMKNVVSGTVYGSIDDPKLTYTGNVKMWAGSNTVSILSVSIGLPVSHVTYYQVLQLYTSTGYRSLILPN